MNRADYAYIVGRVRALETRLVSDNEVERLIDAATLGEAYRVFDDIPFLAPVAGNHAPEAFNQAIEAGLRHIKEMLTRSLHVPSALDFIWTDYDFHNLKVIVKASFRKRGYLEVSHALSSLGTLPAGEWEKHLLEGESIVLPSPLKEALKQSEALYEKTEDLQAVDALLDGLLLRHKLDLAVRMDSPLMTTLLRKRIDFYNLRAFIRSKRLSKEVSYLARLLMPGGSISSSFFEQHYDRGISDLGQLLRDDRLQVALEAFVQQGHFAALDNALSELLDHYFKQTRQMAFGPEPVFAYFAALQNNSRVVRSIMVGKSAGLNRDAIRSGFGTLY